MQPGKLIHRVTIQRLVKQQGPTGKILPDSWETVLEREPAEVLPDRASEYFAAQQIQASTNAMIRIGHRSELVGVVEKIRAVHHIEPGVDEFWDIEGVVPFQYRYREMRLMCLKREAEGYRRGTDVANG
jgi:head-tail adaptor